MPERVLAVYESSQLPSLLQQAWTEWLAEKGSPDSGTVREYRSVWNSAVPMLHEVLRESGGRLSALEVRQFADALLAEGKQPSTVSLYLSVFSSFWSYLQERGVVRDNPWRQVKRPKAPETFAQRILSEEDVLRLIAAAPEGRDRLLVRFLYLSGARVSEAARLRWRDWSTLASRSVVQLYGKGQKTRWVAMPERYYQDLVQTLALPGSRLPSGLYSRRRGRRNSSSATARSATSCTPPPKRRGSSRAAGTQRPGVSCTSAGRLLLATPQPRQPRLRPGRAYPRRTGHAGARQFGHDWEIYSHSAYRVVS